MKPYYSHGGQTIYHGDCGEILPQLGRFDLLLTDPPYGIGESNPKRQASRGKGGLTGFSVGKALSYAREYAPTQFDWDSKTVDIEPMRSICEKQIIFGGNYYVLPPAKCWLVWDKINGDTNFADCELAWTNLDKAVRQFRHMWNGMLREGKEDRFHPTQKPLALMKWCITQAGEGVQTVLDPFLGSGTTLVACKAFGLQGTGIEREESYCEIAAKRLEQEVFVFPEAPPESITPPQRERTI